MTTSDLDAIKLHVYLRRDMNQTPVITNVGSLEATKFSGPFEGGKALRIPLTSQMKCGPPKKSLMGVDKHGILQQPRPLNRPSVN
ncbi:MAG: hypothetical protein CMJ77_11665 [Planctomycetaceae bacterium]|nr:hypothetical protein [Planctomycetaceae bacterium]